MSKKCTWGDLTRLALVATLMASSAAAQDDAAKETLSFAHFVAPNHTITGAVIEPLSEGIAEDTNGALAIDVYPGGELGAGPLEQYVRALQGVADITLGLPGYTSSQFSKTMISEMPGAIPEGMGGYDMLWNAYEQHLLQEFPGTKPLALWAAEPNVFIMKDHVIRTPEDVEGLTLRVSGSITSEVVEALGGTPVQMPGTEIYNAMQTGLIDGAITGSSAVADFKLDEVANSYTIGAPLGHITFYVVMNQDRYDSLPKEMQAAVDANSGRTLSQHAEAAWNAKAEATIQALREAGDNTIVELTDEQAAAFAEKVVPVTERLIAEMGAEDVLAAMRGE